MKKIINGKVYNTETATLVCEYSYGGSGDFNHIFEQLYITKQGTFFINGEGGPMTSYVKHLGPNHTVGGFRMTILTITEAQDFVSAHKDNLENIREIFPDIKEG